MNAVNTNDDDRDARLHRKIDDLKKQLASAPDEKKRAISDDLYRHKLERALRGRGVVLR